LIGGQLMALLAAEHGARLPRLTEDADVLVDVRAEPAALEALSQRLLAEGFDIEVSPTDIGHRFSREADPGPGRVIIDVLAPEGLGPRTRTFTVPPARTVGVPASGALLASAEIVAVEISSAAGKHAVGQVRRPTVLAALIGKAAAATIPVRPNRERDLQDAALLLAILRDPRPAAGSLTKAERRHVRRLAVLDAVEHPAWRVLTGDQARQGRTALALLLSSPALVS
jgi:hypothetical protein